MKAYLGDMCKIGCLRRLMNLLILVWGNGFLTILAVFFLHLSLVLVSFLDTSFVIPHISVFALSISIYLFVCVCTGMYGVLKRSKIFLLGNEVLLVVLAVGTVVVFVYLLINSKESIHKSVSHNLVESLNTGYSNNGFLKFSVDTIQTKRECCGITRSEDWTKMPPSCCRRGENCSEGNSFTQACFAKPDSLKVALLVLDGFLFTVLIVQILFGIFYIRGTK